MTEAKEALPKWPETALIASPRGFCAGVVRAVDILWEVHRQRRAENPSATTYSFHEIIHNSHVVDEFVEAGVQFVNDISEVPDGETLMISAHGASPAVKEQAAARNIKIVDATCPLVEKVHREINKYRDSGFVILHIGHAGHDETVGILGEAPENIKLIETVDDALSVEPPDPSMIAMTTQTTLSDFDARGIQTTLRQRFPLISEPPASDRCFATQNRQVGVRELVDRGADTIVAVGSRTSSNSKRLQEVALEAKAKAYFVNDASELDPSLFYGSSCIGLTSGASVPENIFQEVVSWFQSHGTQEFIEVTVADESKIKFAPPKLSP